MDKWRGEGMALHSWVRCARTVCYRAGKATRRAVPFALPTGCGGCVGVMESWLPVCNPGGAAGTAVQGSMGRGRADPEFAQAGGAGRGGS